MWFNTYTYGVFLIVVFMVYWMLKTRGRQIFLLAASYVFYCWETPIYGVLLLASTLLDYVCGVALGRTDSPAGRRAILLCSIVGNLAMLFFFKYVDFFGESVVGLGRLLGYTGHWKPFDFILPAGISFYTFQTMCYTLQVYRRQIPACHDPVNFALYVAYFPQLVAGPIERADRLLPQLERRQFFRWDDFSYGVGRILLGLFRKMVVADRLAILVDRVFGHLDMYSPLTVWTALAAFAMQVYFDFAGYSDIAIGSARLFGVHLTENFRRPLMARSIAEFWDPWHLTLTAWLREYVFFPLGGSRRGRARTVVNIWILFLLCGLWHGASWNFVLWGAYFAFFNALCYLYRQWRPPVAGHRDGASRVWDWLGIASTFMLVALAAVLFRSPDLPGAVHVLRALIGCHPGAGLETEWDVWVMIALMGVILVVEYRQEYHRLNERYFGWSPRRKALAWLLLILSLIFLSVNNRQPYIYFQF
jgi:alginate O-acetyltransferase complex protein AlgI